MKDIIPFKKKIKGRLYITVSIPFETEINAKYELYEDKLGNPYYEEDYEYSIDDIIDKLPKIKSNLEEFKLKGYTIEEISEING